MKATATKLSIDETARPSMSLAGVTPGYLNKLAQSTLLPPNCRTNTTDALDANIFTNIASSPPSGVYPLIETPTNAEPKM